MTEASTTYQAGDEIDIDGTTVVLASRRGTAGVRWTWCAPELDTAGVAYLPTPEAAIDAARAKLGGPRCACGAPAEMTASTRPTCAACYDRHAD